MRRLLAAFLAVELAIAPGVWAQTPPESQAPPVPSQSPPDSTLPVSLDRIKRGLTAEPSLKLDLPARDDIPRYYMEVTATPDFRTFLEGFDLAMGPVPGAGMTHQEFLHMVTPKDLYSQAGFGALDVLTANLSFVAIMYLATKAFNAMRQAGNERELQQIREQIQRELAELQKANAAKKSGGAPP